MQSAVTYHLDHLRVYVLSNDATLGHNVLEHFVQCLGLDLLTLKFCVGVIEIEDDSALVQLPDKELRAFADGGLCGTWIRQMLFDQEKGKTDR